MDRNLSYEVMSQKWFNFKIHRKEFMKSSHRDFLTMDEREQLLNQLFRFADRQIEVIWTLYERLEDDDDTGFAMFCHDLANAYDFDHAVLPPKIYDKVNRWIGRDCFESTVDYDR